ncbi:hypothetical protein C8A01DRAFT_35199 [Parachaetomium inaequale]|uniref:Uncharacterized protein n=1 Tax=Parachaetomium inaequale TaxID=2588326 RepID=A0AAN6PHN4_9PEZI|nr:hypothetical protein C8A01DRAFT_35199 [Parachaetomium inaequale]
MKLKSAAHLKTFPQTLDGLNKFTKTVERHRDDNTYLKSLFTDPRTHKTPKPVAPPKVTSGGAQPQSQGGAGGAGKAGPGKAGPGKAGGALKAGAGGARVAMQVGGA